VVGRSSGLTTHGSESLIREWRLIQFTGEHPDGISVGAMCRYPDAKRRTVYRDLETLRAAGFAVIRLYRGRHSF
jgi:predicted DNA-binding transcriptional regulator YafY